MVVVQRDSSSSRRRRRPTQFGLFLLISLLVFFLVVSLFRRSNFGEVRKAAANTKANANKKPREVILSMMPPPPSSSSLRLVHHNLSSSSPHDQVEQPRLPTLPYSSLSDLTDEELHPVKGSRHMVTPPVGGRLVLVSCSTTAGALSIVVHDKWAPLGAQRFLDMVSSHYLTDIPLFRCIRNFLCQFGLSSNVASNNQYYKETIADDSSWLPEGKDHRQNENGVKRFAMGYFAYAGSGKNSRNRQLIVSLNNVGTLAGGSPWEVPFGEVVGQHSFETLANIYTGYGDNGPKQTTLMHEGMTEEMRTTFPKLDYLQACRIVDEQVQNQE